jgi:hypothetical protein
MITYQLESWDEYRRNIKELWQEHYEELAQNKRKVMRPHDEYYKVCEQLGMLQLLTARSDGKIIGYCITMVKPHPHYADTLCGFEDAYFLSKDYRKGMVGIRLITETEKFLKQRNVQEIIFMEILSKPLGRLLEYLKYKHTHRVWIKWIGEK